jgi:SAM-dependent MidA family methyltransferase
VGRTLERGLLLLIDYGHEAPVLYGPSHRRGTLLGYRRHRTEEDLLAHVGRQDLTAHVNWTAIDEAAARAGLDGPRRTTQDRFLLALGLGERFRALAGPAGRGDRSALREQLALKKLILPQAMGRRFQVCAYGREMVGEPSGFGPLPDPGPSPDPPGDDTPVRPPRRRIRLVR